jgi:hypothetical protein
MSAVMPHRFVNWSWVMERGADYISIGALVTAVITWLDPAFLTWLTNFSEIAALFMPPVALIWVVTQIWGKWGPAIALWFKWFRGK